MADRPKSQPLHQNDSGAILVSARGIVSVDVMLACCRWDCGLTLASMAEGAKIAGRRGRPRVGEWRLECVLPKAALDELVKRENQSGKYRTAIAREILCDQLLGSQVHSFSRPQ